MQAMKDWHKSHPHLFVKSPRNRPGRDSYRRRHIHRGAQPVEDRFRNGIGAKVTHVPPPAKDVVQGLGLYSGKLHLASFRRASVTECRPNPIG